MLPEQEKLPNERGNKAPMTCFRLEQSALLASVFFFFLFLKKKKKSHRHRNVFGGQPCEFKGFDSMQSAGAFISWFFFLL